MAAAAIAGTVGVASIPAEAAPADSVNYAVTMTDRSVVATLDGGAFTLSDGRESIEIRDTAGQPVDTVPLAFLLGDQRRALNQRISEDGRTLTLTPDLTAPIQPVASPLENQLALNDLASALSRTPKIGMAIGALLGAVIGGVLGLGSCLVVGPACLVTVPAAIAAFAGAGAVTGTLVGGGAALAQTLPKYLLTLQSPPGESPYARDDGLLDPNGTGVPDANLRLPTGSASGSSGGSSAARGSSGGG
ncbi:hypothetical protein ACFU44_31315 [Nocardia rhizosphaerihabitans]|uniref:hypothetical protein n=1 Tax=Nocardia rhizosphaerihabitans TaxID=1691570 RepID=UPI00366F394E